MNFRTKTFLSILATAFALSVAAGDAKAECKTFPDYPLWKTLSHDRAKSYVKRKLKGDWGPYLSHLEKQLKNIEKIIDAEKSARLRHNGEVITLAGNDLVEYRQASADRLSVVECLAEDAEIAALNDFATAAGDEEADQEIKLPAATTSTSPGGRAMNLEVSTSCSNGVSRFKIKNQGADWPKAGSFSIYRIDGATKYSVSSRRMRLKRGQIASFTVKKSRNPTGNLGLFVGPAWYKRSFVYDATLTCL
jgi:hypothetical protein